MSTEGEEEPNPQEVPDETPTGTSQEEEEEGLTEETTEEEEPQKEDEEEKSEDDSPLEELPVDDENASPLETYNVVDSKTRSFIHGKLRAYESRRRSAYTGKLESSSLYWRSFRDLLEVSIHETGRAERLVLGTARANSIYADSMQASYEDVLVDDKGGLVMDEKKQKKLLEVRSQQDYPVAPQPADADSSSKSFSMSEERRANMLSSLVDAQSIFADKFKENSKNLEMEIASELTQMRVDLESKILSIREVGDAIVAELETTETEVAAAWDKYYAIAVKTLMSSGGNRNSRSAPPKPTDTEEGEDIMEDCLDVWIVEMHYRVAVAYQSFAWEKASAELSKLFASMKDTECQRRVNVRELLVAFIQRQERLYVALPDVQTPVLKNLVGRDMERPTLEAQLQNDIRKRAERLAREEAKKKKKDETESKKALAIVENSEDGNFTLQSPMASDLMKRSKIVERKTANVISSWKLSLAVITADSFLHLFDLPSGKVNLRSAPEAAFQLLIPQVKVPVVDFSITGDSRKKLPPSTSFVKGWCEMLVPTESIVLPNCSISQPKLNRDTSSFDIQEAMFSTGASQIFGKTTSKKVTLRTYDKTQTQELIAALTEEK